MLFNIADNDFHFLGFSRFLSYAQQQIRAVERGNINMFLGAYLQAKLFDNVLSCYLVGRCRKGHDGRLGKFVVQNAQLRIFRSEVVSPLTDAVGFVNSNQTDFDFAEQKGYFGNQSFGRHIEKFDVSRKTTAFDDEVLVHIVAAVECFC